MKTTHLSFLDFRFFLRLEQASPLLRQLCLSGFHRRLVSVLRRLAFRCLIGLVARALRLRRDNERIWVISGGYIVFGRHCPVLTPSSQSSSYFFRVFFAVIVLTEKRVCVTLRPAAQCESVRIKLRSGRRCVGFRERCRCWRCCSSAQAPCTLIRLANGIGVFLFCGLILIPSHFSLRRHQFVGTVDDALFNASGTRIFVSTSDGVVASFNARTGDIGTSLTSVPFTWKRSSSSAWRQVLDTLSGQNAAPAIHYVSKTDLLYSLDADGRFLRAWTAETGIMKFEAMLSEERCDTASRCGFVFTSPLINLHLLHRMSLFQAPNDDRLITFYGNGRVASVNMRNGEVVWTAKAETPYTRAALHEDTLLLARINGGGVQRATLSAISGDTVKVEAPYTAARIDERLVTCERHRRTLH